LWVSHAGFRTEDNQDTATLTLRPASANHVTVRLVPQSMVQGRIVNLEGEAVRGIRVHAIRVDIRDGRRQLQPVPVSQFTDDRGEYHLENLSPGSYYLRAAGPGYGPVYYPSAPSLEAARFLRIVPAQKLSADFQVEARHGYQIRGRVANMPVRRRVSVRLLRDGDVLDNQVAVHGDSGVFEINDVASGSYVVQAYIPDLLPLFIGELAVEVGERDLVGATVALQSGTDVAGRVDFSGVQERYALVYATRVNSTPLPVSGRAPTATVTPDGRFVFRNLSPGKYEVTVHAFPDSYVSSILSGTTDVQAEGLTIGRNGPPDLKITLQPVGGRIEGLVESDHADGPFNVVLVHKQGAAQIPTVVRASQGRFRAAGLAPGQYTLFAWHESRNLEYRNAWVLSGLAAYAVSLTLGQGEIKNIALTPVPEQPLQ